MKTLLFVILISFSLSIKSQNCLFGYISDNSIEYNQVVDYLKSLNIPVISTCEEEYLIYITLNKKYKDYTNLFSKIEKIFTGKCYYKSQNNKIPYYTKCEQYLKK